MNSVQRQKKEWLKEQLDRMESNEHIQIFNIIKKDSDELNTNYKQKYSKYMKNPIF